MISSFFFSPSLLILLFKFYFDTCTFYNELKLTDHRTKYLVTLIGKLHKFYSINVMSRDLSALSLFDDITKISTNRNSTPTIRHSTPNPTSEQSSWTYNVPSFRRNTKVIRRPSSSAASSSSGSRDRITSGNSCPAKEPPITSDSVPGICEL